MAYVTGQASTLADLLFALRNACTANGWTLSGNVLRKGTCFAEVKLNKLNIAAAPANGAISVLACNGIDGSNNPTDAMAQPAFVGFLNTTGSLYPAWDFPVTYHIHVNTAPDEVYLLVNYNAGLQWQWLGFGQSPAPGNAGTGNWAAASLSNYTGVQGVATASCLTGGAVQIGGSFSYPRFCPIPFWIGGFGDATANQVNYAIHGAINDTNGTSGWSPQVAPATAAGFVCAAWAMVPLLDRTPNSWNSETVLLPVEILQLRASAKTSIIGELGHLRMCRNDYLPDGTVVPLSPDRWKVYPCYQRNTTTRNGGDNVNHSGTIAMAIRYDGP